MPKDCLIVLGIVAVVIVLPVSACAAFVGYGQAQYAHAKSGYERTLKQLIARQTPLTDATTTFQQQGIASFAPCPGMYASHGGVSCSPYPFAKPNQVYVGFSRKDFNLLFDCQIEVFLEVDATAVVMQGQVQDVCVGP